MGEGTWTRTEDTDDTDFYFWYFCYVTCGMKRWGRFGRIGRMAADFIFGLGMRNINMWMNTDF